MSETGAGEERIPTPGPDLFEVARRFREHPGLRTKASLALVTEVLGDSDWLRGPGDDASAIPEQGTHLLLAGEAVWPPFVKADPFGAGAASVVANVNDVAAMGGRPLGLVDTVVGPEPLARQALEGMRFAAGLYGVRIVGGHLTVREGPPAVSAFVAGRAARLLPAREVAAGQVLLFACCLEGHLREDFPFFSSLRGRGDRVAGDIELLPRGAEEGACLAAKDVSMAGVLGSLAMLLEPSGSGAAVDLDRLPRPDGVGLADWTSAFPTFAFFLCTPPDRAEGCRAMFVDRGLACEEVGAIDDTGRLRARLDGREASLIDLTKESVTRLGKPRAGSA